ncbi:MAG: ABC transporter substrate-binding protein [Patescibacteria group bacterium]
MSNLSFPNKNEIRSALAYFSKKEWMIFFVLLAILFISTIAILESVNKSFMVSVPARGGTISEGIIGAPRFVNPVLALSDADKDLVSLIYSGLMRKNPDGTLAPDLAEKYDVSPDGLTYTFTLKDKIYFHDSKPVTADDIIFTVSEAKDPIIKSPIKGNWDGINVEKVDDKTIKFTLKQPYASFLENATLGIMPKSLWSNSPIELNETNMNPVGSGPYEVSNVSKQSSGIIDSYELSYFSKFILSKPYVKNITLKFYPNEGDLITALQGGNINQASSITPENAEKLKNKGYRIESSVLPRVFGLFFNQNQAQIFTDKHVIEAINQAVDKDRIVREVLSGYGVAIDDPIPPNMIAYQKLTEEDKSSREENLQKAQDILTKDGWKKNADGFLEKTAVPKTKAKTSKTKSKVVAKVVTASKINTIEFTISTGNAPELTKTAELVAEDLRAIGMKVDVKTFEVGNLNQSVIRPRKYDALLFGQIINHESDLFAFWHSSQRKDPGLNIAMYTNAKVDKILEDALVTLDENNRVKKYAQFENEIKKDSPAVFIYSPDFIYAVSKNLNGLAIDHLISPADRFANSYSWYTEKTNVWKMFSKFN